MTIDCNTQNSIYNILDNHMKEQRERQMLLIQLIEKHNKLKREWNEDLEKSNQEYQNFQKIAENTNLMIENHTRNFKMSNSPITVQNDFMDHSLTINEIFSTKEIKKAEIEEENEKVKEPNKSRFF